MQEIILSKAKQTAYILCSFYSITSLFKTWPQPDKTDVLRNAYKHLYLHDNGKIVEHIFLTEMAECLISHYLSVLPLSCSREDYKLELSASIMLSPSS